MADESSLRLGFFIVVFAIFAYAETQWPRRRLRTDKAQRWLNNITLTFFNSLILRLFTPVAAVSASMWAAKNYKGLFNIFGDGFTFNIVEFIVVIILLDLVIYWQHVIFHKVPILWRLHRMHHTDRDLDVTSGARFHTIELILSMFIKVFFIVILGASVTSVVAFEIILNAMAMFNHSNTKIPEHIDSKLRKVIVTPDFHRVHHSEIPQETNSNYGFNLSIWDRIFKSYRAQPEEGHEDMTIGLSEFTSPDTTTNLFGLLMLPFKK